MLYVYKEDLLINKASALRIARQAFQKNKRTTKVIIKSMSRWIHIEYKGKRDMVSIERGVSITKVMDR